MAARVFAREQGLQAEVVQILVGEWEMSKGLQLYLRSWKGGLTWVGWEAATERIEWSFDAFHC